MTSIKRIETSEELARRMDHYYRQSKRAQMRLELREHQTPTEEGRKELAEMTGFLRGMKKAMELIGTYRNSTQLPMFGDSA